MLHEHSISDPFVFAARVEAIGSGEVDDGGVEGRGNSGAAGLFVDRNAGEIAHFLVKAGKGIKEGAFSAVGVAYQCNMKVFLRHKRRK